MTENPTFRVYTYDKALRRTINRNYRRDASIGCCKKYILIITCGATFQVVLIILTTLMALLSILTTTFQALLEKNPNKLECYHDEEGAPDGGEWRECTKEYICG